jgi:hypothetical protein
LFLKDRRDVLASDEWRFGESPSFSINVTKKFAWGLCDLYIDYETGGRVARSKLYSDALSPELVAALQAGVDAQLDEKIAKHFLGTPELFPMVDEFFDWVKLELRT